MAIKDIPLLGMVYASFRFVIVEPKPSDKPRGRKMKNGIALKWLAAGLLASGFLLSGCAPVTLDSVPEGAAVYNKKSDKKIGETPAKITLYANSRKVLLRKEGYLPKTVLLSPVGSDHITVELQKKGKLLVLSHPNGAELYVDGKMVGRTPFRFDDKPYETYELRAPGYNPSKLEIPSDPEGNLVVNLQREPAVRVESKPKNVEVFDGDGMRLGVTPISIPATTGRKLELCKEGYYSKEVTIGKDTESPFVVELKREPVVIVYSEPQNAIVVSRGVTLGKTPFRHLVEKDMELELSAPRYYTEKITISPDSPRSVYIKLKPKPYITIHSSPAHAKLYRPGRVELIGTTPIEILVEKDTSFEMHKPGYAVKTFTLSPDSKSEVTVPLDRSAESPGRVVLVDSKPSGAKIYRPGGAELIGTTPLKLPVPVERTLELHHEGYLTKTVSVAPDSADKVVFSLEKDKAAGNATLSDPLLNAPSTF